MTGDGYDDPLALRSDWAVGQWSCCSLTVGPFTSESRVTVTVECPTCHRVGEIIPTPPSAAGEDTP